MITVNHIQEKLEVLFHQEATCYRTDDYIDIASVFHPSTDEDRLPGLRGKKSLFGDFAWLPCS